MAHSGIFRNVKGDGYILGEYFQKCSSFSINFFHIFFTSKWEAQGHPLNMAHGADLLGAMGANAATAREKAQWERTWLP